MAQERIPSVPAHAAKIRVGCGSRAMMDDEEEGTLRYAVAVSSSRRRSVRARAFVITCLRQNLKSFDTCCGRRTRARVERCGSFYMHMRVVPLAVLGYPNAPMTWLSGLGVTSPRDANRALALAKSR